MNNYVISLSHATDRRQHIMTEFSKQDIRFRFFDAVTPDNVDTLAQKFNINIINTKLTKGELACLLSHVSLWQKMIDDDLEYIAIFEDDIYLGKNANLFLNNHHWIPKECTIIKIEHFLDRLILGSSVALIENRHLKPLKEFNWGTAGYIIHQSAASLLMSTLIKQFNQKPLPIDHVMFDVGISKYNLPIYQMTPSLCVQSDRPQQSGSIKSTLEVERRARMSKQNNIPITPIQKIFRELKRPFIQIFNFFKKYNEHQRLDHQREDIFFQ